MDKDSVYQMFYPDKFVQECRDKYRAFISIFMGCTKYYKEYINYFIIDKLTNHLEYKQGIVVEVNWSSPTISYVDTLTGEMVNIYVLVGVLPYSQYPYVELCWDMKMDSFLRIYIQMYNFL